MNVSSHQQIARVNTRVSLKLSVTITLIRGRSQDGGGIGRGDHFLFYKFIEITTER